MITCGCCGNTDQALFMGHVVRGVYDGVLWWECLACGWGFARKFEGMERRNAAALHHANEHNARRTAGQRSVGPGVSA